MRSSVAFLFEIYFMRPCFAQRRIDEEPFSILEEIKREISINIKAARVNGG